MYLRNFIIFTFFNFFIFSAMDAKKFVIMTTSYNNKAFYKKNLDSVFNQTYTDWEMVYVDDLSTDGTDEAVRNYIKEKGFDHKVTFVRNTEKCYCLGNYYREIHQVTDDKIIVTLDGDDAFNGNDVLEYLNDIYTENSDVWCTFGNFLCDPPNGYALVIYAFPPDIIQNNRFRNYHWNVHHLRSFYAGLFKKIKLEDFLYEGQFIKVVEDIAFMMPILEQCGIHHQFIERPLYLYNTINPLQASNVWKLDLRIRLRDFLYAKPKYTPLLRPPYEQKSEQQYYADMIILNLHGPDALLSHLLEMQNFLTGVGKIYVIFTSKPSEQKNYQKIRKRFPDLTFIESTAAEGILKESAPYVVVCTDESRFEKQIALHDCIKALNKTGSGLFILNTTRSRLGDYPFVPVENDMSAFQVHFGPDLRATDFGVLIRNEDLQNKKVLKNITSETFANLSLDSFKMDMNEVILTFN